MSEWKTVRLTDIAAPGGLAGGPFGSSLGTKDYVGAGIPVIRGSNLGSKLKFDLSDFVYVTQEKAFGELSRNLATPGDVVFTQRGTLGQVGVVPWSPHSHYVISQSQMRLRLNQELALAEFIYYQFRAPTLNREINNRAITTGVPHINLRILGELEVPLPCLSEQRAIVAILGALDDKIAFNGRIAGTCHELAQAISAKTHADAEKRALTDIAVVTMGSSPPGESYNAEGIGMPFYQGTRDFGARFPSRRVWCTSPIRIAQAGSTLVSVRAPVGRVNVAREVCCIGRGVASVASRQGTPSVLFHELAASSKAWLPYESEGTVFGSISGPQLEGLRIKSVDSPEALVLEQILKPLDQRLASADRDSQVLAGLRDTLLPRLMSGEIRVRDAEKIVEDAT